MSHSRLVENEFRPHTDSLFHEPEFYRLHLGEAGKYFQWIGKKNEVAATVHYTELEGGHWRSPARGTFSGYAFDPALDLSELANFHDGLEERLYALGARTIEVLLAPQAYDPVVFANSAYILLSRGFGISRCDINHSLEVTDASLVERMNYGNRKRLRKCERKGLIGRLLPSDALPVVFETIAINRASKGYDLSMSLPELQTMMDLFPERILLFGASSGEELAAAAVCMRVRHDVSYVFYWGDRPAYSSSSPVVALADAIYDHSRANGIRLLDVGTSSEGSHLNSGLVHFKRALGFSESIKLRMVKNLQRACSAL